MTSRLGSGVSRIGCAGVIALAVGVLTACGSSSSHAGAPATSSGGSPSAQVSALFTSFFDGATSATTKVGQLQDGTAFSSLLQAQAKSALAKQASAKVSKVVLNAAGTQAAVTYTISIAGQAALPNQSGIAVMEGGQWKVADASFCGLLTLEQANAPECKGVTAPPSS